MECRININGDLIIEAMSETEAFALKKWEVFFKSGNSCIKAVIKPSGAPWDAENNVIRIDNYKK
jgi:hypothetical protein